MLTTSSPPLFGISRHPNRLSLSKSQTQNARHTPRQSQLHQLSESQPRRRQSQPTGPIPTGTPKSTTIYTTPLSSRIRTGPRSASAVYEPLLRRELRRRLTMRVFPLVGLAALAAGVVWVWWSCQGGAYFSREKDGNRLENERATNFGHSVMLSFLAGFLLWSLAGVPVVVCRKFYLSPTRTPATSFKQILQISSLKAIPDIKTRPPQPLYRPAFIICLISSLAILVLHVLAAYTLELPGRGDPKLSLFVKSRKHPLYLNARLLFLIVSQVTTALVFYIRLATQDRFAFNWSLAMSFAQSSDPPSLQSVTLDTIFSILFTNTLLTSFLVLPLSCLVILVLRLVVLPGLYAFPLLHFLLRPLTGHFMRRPGRFLLAAGSAASRNLLWRAWFIAWTTGWVWEVACAAWDWHIHQPIRLGRSTPDRPYTLVSGATRSESLIFRWFAFEELCTLVSSSESEAVSVRDNIFNDQKYSPRLWVQLVRESLLLLGKDYQVILKRGKWDGIDDGRAAADKLGEKNEIALEKDIGAKPVEVVKGASVFLRPHASANMGGVVEKDQTRMGLHEGNVPELFQSIVKDLGPEAQKNKAMEEAKQNPAEVVGMLRKALNDLLNVVVLRIRGFLSSMPVHLPERIKLVLDEMDMWWNHERVHKVVQGRCLPHAEIDLVVIDVLSHLVCASLAEDKFGVVQRDIPRILEALLAFLAAVEEYRKELQEMYGPLASEEANKDLNELELRRAEAVRLDVLKAYEVLDNVRDGLREGVARIVRLFGEKLLAYKFPALVAARLQPFMEYR